jgi:hypothetical protein
MSTTTKTRDRANRFPGECVACKQLVPAGAGILRKTLWGYRIKCTGCLDWTVDHRVELIEPERELIPRRIVLRGDDGFVGISPGSKGGRGMHDELRTFATLDHAIAYAKDCGCWHATAYYHGNYCDPLAHVTRIF